MTFHDTAFLLENGISYHLANLTALTEYLTTLYLKPSWKAWPYLSEFGTCHPSNFERLPHIIQALCLLSAAKHCVRLL
jgi:hypothetical protein